MSRQPIEQRLCSRKHDKLCTLPESDFNQRRRVDVDMKQIRNNPVHFTRNFALRLSDKTQNVLYATAESFQSIFQFAQNSDSFADARQLCFRSPVVCICPRKLTTYVAQPALCCSQRITVPLSLDR